MKNFNFKNLSRAKFFVIGISVLLIYTASTNATNISINNSSNIEFGQGIILATNCDTYLTVKLTREFDGATANYYLKNVILGDISTKLHDKRVTIALRNRSANSVLSTSNLYVELDSNGIVFTSPLTHVDSIDYTTNGGGSNAEEGASSITFQDVRNNSNAKILADDIDQVSIETSGGGGCTAPTLSCATVSSLCQLGSTGPGGGVVFYIANTTFREPVSGNTFKYIEVAPKNWIPGVIDPYARLCSAYSISQALSSAIGSAKQNTDAFIAQSNCTGTYQSSSDPAGLAKVASTIRSYDNPYISGSSDVGTWHLGTLNEMIQLCKVARFGASLAAAKTNCNDTGGNLDTVNWRSSPAYPMLTSSKQSGAGWATYIYFTTGVINDTSAIQTTIGYFRPIRYFN